MNWEASDVQSGFRKGRGTGDQIVKNCWIIEKARKFPHKKSTSASLTVKALTLWITTNYGKFLKRWEHQTTLLVFWETCMQVKKQVRTRHGTSDRFKIEKWVHQDCILSLCLFNFYAEYIMQHARLGESQAGIKGGIVTTSDVQMIPL